MTTPQRDAPKQETLIRGRLKSGSFHVYASCDLDPRDIDDLISILQAQKAVLLDDEESNP